MADLETIAAGSFRPLSSTSTRAVKDAFMLALAPEDEFVESDVAIELLEFASSVVGGLASAASTPLPGATRSTSRVEVPLADSAGGTASAGLTVTVYGPGDVRGIDTAQVVRRFPAPGTLTAEETVLAHIEFDRPELPWAFSAVTQAAVMRPWLTLVVVEKSTVLREPATSALLPVVQVPLAQLPVLARADLWAHAQAPRTDRATEQDLSARLSPAHAPVNLSRLVSPRILTQDTDYVAMVVPTTDVGVRGGLGLTGGTLDPAWTSASPDPVRLPVYDSWEFTTGPNGDFRSLALQLQGIAAPYEVGRKFIDTSEPGEPLLPLDADELGRLQVLRCALFSPTPPVTAEQQTAENAVWPSHMIDDLRMELDRPATIEGTEKQTDGVPNLPIIGPRIYAKLHRGSPVIEGSDWFAELNLAPVKRIVGGLGTRVVQRDQERLMQSAWAQLGEVEAANRAIHLAQLAELLATRLHTRLGKLQAGKLLQVAAPLATRISVTAGTTLFADISVSSTPVTATQSAFRRVSRPTGPVVRRADAAARRRLGYLVGTDAALRDFTRVYRNPEGIGGLSADALKDIDLRLVSASLDVPLDAVGGVLQEADASVQRLGSFASYLTTPTAWADVDVAFDFGAEVATRWSEVLLRSSSTPAVNAIRAQRVGPLVAELSLSKTADRGPMRDRLQKAAVTLNDKVRSDLGVPVRPLDGIRLHPERIGPVSPFLRRSPIGLAVGRLPRGGVGELITEERVGRIGIEGRVGLGVIDVQHLKNLGGVSDPAELEAGLRLFADLAVVKLTPNLDAIEHLHLDALRAEMISFVDPSRILAIEKVPRREMLTTASDALSRAIDPMHTVRESLRGRLRIPGTLGDRWFAQPKIAPIMAAPRFDRPMYQALADYDREWLIPGLGLLPDDDFVTVLSTNNEFMTAFFVGLSDEMGRELLWRGYPTDQRGTYFHRFWSASKDDLATPIHLFPSQSLAKQISLGGGDSRAVIVVKSELVRRFPDLIVQAVKNQGTVREPVFEKAGSPQQTAEILFADHLEPDIALIGVDLSVDQLDGDEWWITISEHPSATRFQRPADDQLPVGARHLTDTAADAAVFADDHLHRPVRVAFQATDLIVREG